MKYNKRTTSGTKGLSWIFITTRLPASGDVKIAYDKVNFRKSSIDKYKLLASLG
jgi:hypothetical protein